MPRFDPPSSRRHHASLSLGEDLLLLHGGQLFNKAPSHAICSELHLLHVPSLRWAQPPVLFLAGAPPLSAASFAPPPRRCGHCAQAVEAGGAGMLRVCMVRRVARERGNDECGI